jgi:hypothetical protein
LISIGDFQGMWRKSYVSIPARKRAYGQGNRPTKRRSQTSPSSRRRQRRNRLAYTVAKDLGRNVTARIDYNVTGHDQYVTPVTQEAKQE